MKYNKRIFNEKGQVLDIHRVIYDYIKKNADEHDVDPYSVVLGIESDDYPCELQLMDVYFNTIDSVIL